MLQYIKIYVAEGSLLYARHLFIVQYYQGHVRSLPVPILYSFLMLFIYDMLQQVKTTSPKRYCVRPNIGVILPMSSSGFTGLQLAILDFYII